MQTAQVNAVRTAYPCFSGTAAAKVTSTSVDSIVYRQQIILCSYFTALMSLYTATYKTLTLQ